MKKILQLILSLTLISAVCAAVLAIVNNATKERIANLATLKANNAARAVLPASVKAIEPVKDPADASLTAFIGYADDAKTQIAGYAVPGLTAKGYGGNIQAAEAVGKLVAKRALEKGIENVVFDRGGYLYHGRVKALAEGAREGGLKF